MTAIRRAGARMAAVVAIVLASLCLLLAGSAQAAEDPAGPDDTSDTGDTGENRTPEQQEQRAAAEASYAAEQELARRFAPVLMLVRQDEACGPGEPFTPTEVDPMLDNPTVALRGPWTPRDLVDVGPSAERLGEGLRGYSLDLPGDPLDPGCDYERWARSVWGASPAPVAYAHVARQGGRVALQYFFFYAFNDYNNKHEVDWERIQLDFEAPDAETALTTDPVRAVYSQHYGAEQTAWDDDALERDGDQPVVYVSAGSHANQFSPGVFIGNSAVTGFGCDTTLGPHLESRPSVRTIPSDPALAAELFPWITYQGHWGEVGPVRFYEGPTGPNRKAAWTRPFTWSNAARETSIQVPGAQAAGADVAQFYCDAVGQGSDLFRRYTARPWPTLLVLGGIALLFVWSARRRPWGSPPLPLAQRRRPGQVVGAAAAMVRARPWLFTRAAVPLVGLNLLAAVLQGYGVSQIVPYWLAALGSSVGLGVLFVAGGAVALLVRELSQGHEPSVRAAYAASLRVSLRALPLLLGLAALTVLGATSLVLLPVAVVLLAVWMLLPSVVALEERVGPSAALRGLRLLRATPGPVFAVLGLAALLATAAGALLAALLFLVVPVSFVVLGAVPPLVLALLWPFVTVMGTYAYHVAAAVAAEPRPERQDPLSPAAAS